jgi:GNAT superfamily N-acetyltransferase
MPADPRVRPATVDDARGIAEVHVAAWRETYTRLLPAGALDDLDVDARAERWTEILGGDAEYAWVATRGDRIVGWATVGSGPVTDERPRQTELNGIYVLAALHGSGAGQRLLDAAIADRAAYLWLAGDNPRAAAFYRRNGFALDGAVSSHPLAGHPVEIVRMVR